MLLETYQLDLFFYNLALFWQGSANAVLIVFTHALLLLTFDEFPQDATMRTNGEQGLHADWWFQLKVKECKQSTSLQIPYQLLMKIANVFGLCSIQKNKI